jgi:hypothetical protein
MSAVATAIGNCDGYSVATPAGVVGWVEEMWLDDSGNATALAVRLLDGRRGLLVRDEIDEVAHERRAVAIGTEARILRLEPPHVHAGTNGAPVASWAATGAPLELPEPAGVVRGALAGLHRPVVPRTTDGGISTFRTVVVMFASIAFIGLSVIGLDILIAYLATGHPPY